MSQYLKKWRELLGFTLQDVSAKIGRHFTTIQKWESGKNAVGTRDLELLGKAYGIPPMALSFDPKDQRRVRQIMRTIELVTAADPELTDTWLKAFESAVQQGQRHAGGDGDYEPSKREKALDASSKRKNGARKKD